VNDYHSKPAAVAFEQPVPFCFAKCRLIMTVMSSIGRIASLVDGTVMIDEPEIANLVSSRGAIYTFAGSCWSTTFILTALRQLF